MRGAGRIGGRNFKMPEKQRANPAEDLFNVVSPIGIYDLPVPPRLEPINEGWSISNFDDPVDAKDCAAYPASPYCDGGFLDIKPLGYRVEIRSNECETCIYTYPIIGFLVLQPTIICKRDPNCGKKEENKNWRTKKPSHIPYVMEDENTSSECAQRINYCIDYCNLYNSELKYKEIEYTFSLNNRKEGDIYSESKQIISKIYSNFTINGKNVGYYLYQGEEFRILAGTAHGIHFWDGTKYNFFNYDVYGEGIGIGYNYVTFHRGDACPPPPPPFPPPPPPPPYSDGGSNKNDKIDKNKKKTNKDKKMCCNSCNDAADSTAALLKEIKAIKKAIGEGIIKVPKSFDSTLSNKEGKTTDLTQSLEYFGKLISQRLGTGRYPIEVPLSLLTGVGDKTQEVHSQTDYLYWLTLQLDALIGEFPIKIKIKDIDPLKEGDQEQEIIIPNIAEAIAEMYGITMKTGINQEVELNMLLRLAAEVIATKNGVAITQDYARANADFLGYKGNKVTRELTYNFDLARPDLLSGETPIVIESLLKTVTGSVEGWKNDDKESLMDYLKRLMFAAGIIKAAFFRNKKQVGDIKEGIDDMYGDNKETKNRFEEFIQAIKNPQSDYNKNSTEKPDIKKQIKDPNKP